MSRIKLALVNETTIGGVRRHVLDIARNLNREKFEVTVILGNRQGHEGEGDPFKEFRTHNISCISSPMRRELSPYQDLRAFLFLRKILAGFDVIHAHAAKAGFLARLACRSPSAGPCIYSPHVFAFQRSSPLKARFYLRLEKMAAPWTTVFVVNSDGEKQCALESGLAAAGNIFVLPHAIPRPPALPQTARQDIRSQLGTTGSSKVFLSLGRLIAYKGHHILLKAFAHATSGKNNTELWIAGEGQELNGLVGLSRALGIQDKTRFLGFRKDVHEVLSAADCFVLASQSEGCPYSILEALAMEKPIIATAVPGTAELLLYSKHSRLVPWNNVDALSKAISAYLENPFHGAPLENLPLAFFDVRGQIQTLEDIYTSTVGLKKSGSGF
jgi:glycosyltransferase involved in cell wall biosynthesis